MATKQITDLGAAVTFDDGDLLLVRKTAEGIDKKIAQADFIKSFGNPAINGFTAISEAANKLTLTASNDVVVDTYYDGMTACFISDINSNGVVQIKVGTLAYKDFLQYGGTQSVVLSVNKYLEAIYIGDNTTGKWYQTNVAIPTVFTNEYTAVGAVAGNEQSTTYNLTSATVAIGGTAKTQYYNGMSLLFTTDVASKGAVLLNVDGLGIKNLTDQDGDNIAFNLAAKETVMAIYDGTNFIKNLFAEKDKPLPPINPELPIPPENQIVINVGASQNLTSINDAILQLIESYGEDGGNRYATIQLGNDYVGNEELRVITLTPWITIQSYNTGTTFTSPISINKGAISLKGIFTLNSNFYNKFILIEKGYVNVTDSTINFTGTTVGYSICVDYDDNANEGQDLGTPTVFKNVNINGFDMLVESSYSNFQNSRSNFEFTDGVCNLNQNTNSRIIQSYGRVALTNVNFSNVNRPDGYDLFDMERFFEFNNVNITTSSNVHILTCYNNTVAARGVLKNCNMRNTTTNILPTIVTRNPIAFDGGDFRHPNSSSNPDILIENYPPAKCTRTNGTLANFDVKTPNGQLTDI